MVASSGDIRVQASWLVSTKRAKLERRLGPAGVLAVMDLWVWTGASKPNGDLSGIDDEEIEIAARWGGEAGALVSAMAE